GQDLLAGCRPGRGAERGTRGGPLDRCRGADVEAHGWSLPVVLVGRPVATGGSGGRSSARSRANSDTGRRSRSPVGPGQVRTATAAPTPTARSSTRTGSSAAPPPASGRSGPTRALRAARATT